MSATVDLLERLSNADGVPGFEAEVRSIFEEHWQGVGEVRHDRLGSVIVERPGPAGGPRVAIVSHMDEVGFMVRVITRSGLLRVVPLGGWWSGALPAQRVRVLTAKGKVDGVIAATPPHLLGKGDRDRAADMKDLLIDVGAASRGEAEELGIRPGSAVVPATSFLRFAGGSRVTGKAFDDRLGCALCIETLVGAPSDLPCTLVGVGSVQEEVGLRGAQTAIRVAHPDLAIVLEGSPADDVGGGPTDEAQGRLGGGAQLRAFDPTMVAPRGLVDLALEVAQGGSIPLQLAVRPTGGTDAGRIHLEGVGIPTIVLAAPVRYAHSHASVLDVTDLDAVGQLVRALLPCLDMATFQERVLGTGATA